MFELIIIEQKRKKLRFNGHLEKKELKNPSSQMNGKKDF